MKRIVYAFRHFQDKVSTRWDGDVSTKFRHLKWQVAIMSYLYTFLSPLCYTGFPKGQFLRQTETLVTHRPCENICMCAWYYLHF